MATINIRCTEDQKQMLVNLANKHNRSISKVIIQLIEDGYSKIEGIKPSTRLKIEGRIKAIRGTNKD